MVERVRGLPERNQPLFFNMSSCAAGLRNHFLEHGFHWTGESHNVDMMSLDQVLQCSLHADDACDGSVVLHMVIRWSADEHLAVQDWMAENGTNVRVPDEFAMPLEFDLELPPLENPPDLLETWMGLLQQFDGSMLRVDVSATDHIESPTEKPRRHLLITASCMLPLHMVIPYEGDDLLEEYPLCKMIDGLRDLCRSVSESVEQWGPADSVG